jgi:hypothetical protein
MDIMDPQRDRWKLSHYLLIISFDCMGTIGSFDLQISSGVDLHLMVYIKKLPLAVAFDIDASMNKTECNKTACLCLVVKDPFQRYIDDGWTITSWHLDSSAFNYI